MFGIGFGEFVVIGVLLLMAVGPRRMPVMMKSLGRAMREFRKATRELRAQVGLDELMAEDDPVRPAPKPQRSRTKGAPGARGSRALADAVPISAQAQEYPPEGVDVAESSPAPTPPAAEA